jgi:hypothetical protein
MTAKLGAAESWVSVGSSTTSPVDNRRRAQVALDSYYVVVGFEVNKASAFIDEVHDLAIDYGHAFVYLVKNKTIKNSFSFGPGGLGKIGWFNKGKVMTSKKDGFQNARPATADYGITEIVKAFKILVSIKQATSLEKEIEQLRREIYTGALQYSALMNDTCAETAKELLDDAGVQTPSGSGPIKHSKMANFPFVYAVNPYKWHKNFKASYTEMTFKPAVVGEWIPVVGEDDPIFGVPAFAKADPVFGVGL